MKSRKAIAFLLSFVVAFSLCCPVQVLALDETNESGITFTVELDKSSVPVSTTAQTVYMTVKPSEQITIDGFSYYVTCAKSLNVSGFSGETLGLSNENWESSNDFCSKSEFEGNVQTNDLGTIAITVPGDTPEGIYTVGVSNIYLTANNYEVWEGNESAESPAYATTTLTVGNPSAYSAGISTTNTAVSIEDSVAISINATHTTATQFASSEIILSYDSSKLTYVSTTNVDSSRVNSSTAGTLKIEDCGADKNLGNGIYTVNFTAAAKGEATVTLTGAAFSDKKNAEKKDLTAAAISTASTTVKISKNYSVSYPNETYISGNTQVEEGQNYTLTVLDYANYNYTVTATMGGNDTTVIDNEDGTYTVNEVSGDLVFSVSRSGKTVDITYATTTGVTLPKNTTATYGTDFTFDLPTEDHYTITLDSAVYTGTETTVEYSIESGKVTIKGDKLTGNITLTLNKVQADATVSVEGTGASDAAGYVAYATPGEAYTLTVTEDSKYTYSVTVKVNGNAKNLTNDVSGQYTLAAADVVAGTIVFTVNKTVKSEGISVAAYLTLNGTSMWLIKNETAKLDGSVYTYKGENMYWSDGYNAYCTLVIAESQPTMDAADFAIVTGTANEITGYDVNKTGKVDANDAQLVYNMYNAQYSGFTEDVTIIKYLLADANHSGAVDTNDVAAVISSILNS